MAGLTVLTAWKELNCLTFHQHSKGLSFSLCSGETDKLPLMSQFAQLAERLPDDALPGTAAKMHSL